ncbi:MAG: patatin-like phospholipase family protein [Candidatus Cloacimonetes bacterium]|nr:patatin-like phospholipase family protein [Candidatus Cloacimonadota bacterium]
MRRIGLSLGGGGARGVAHIEFLKAMDELNLKPSIISGTSIGAIIGVFYAAGLSGVEIEELLFSHKIDKFSGLLNIGFNFEKGLFLGKSIEGFFEDNIPVKTFEELKIPLKVVATDYWNRSEFVFESGLLLPAIRASMSIPVVYEPVKYSGHVLVDGGLSNPLPYEIINDECDFSIAIDVLGVRLPENKDDLPNKIESMIASFEILEAALIRKKIEALRPDCYIKPRIENVELLDFVHSKKILQSVKPDAEEFRKIIKAALLEDYPEGKLKKWLEKVSDFLELKKHR